MEKYKSLVTGDDEYPVSRIENSVAEWHSDKVYSGYHLRNEKMYVIIENDRVIVIKGEINNGRRRQSWRRFMLIDLKNNVKTELYQIKISFILNN